jgi:hypothetical protein
VSVSPSHLVTRDPLDARDTGPYGGAMTTCPTCRQQLPDPEPTPQRPHPLPDHRHELLARLATDGGLTATSLARRLYAAEPTRSQIERARQVLADAVTDGVLFGNKDEQGVIVYLPRVNLTGQLLELLTITGVQTAHSAACHLFDTGRPKPAETERARRRLESLVSDSRAVKRQQTDGQVTYHPALTSVPATG